LVLARQPPCPFVAGGFLTLLQRTIAGRATQFTMPHGRRKCELAMTQVLQFYDASDVCRII
jgi:hypothetical protein